MIRDAHQVEQVGHASKNDDAVWANVSASIGRPEMKYSDPSVGEPLTEATAQLSQVMAGFARQSVAYIMAQGAMIDAGIDIFKLDQRESRRAADREENAIDNMEKVVQGLPREQLNTVLAVANEQLEGSGMRFAVNQFGGVALVEGNKAIWPLGKPIQPKVKMEA